MYYTTSTYTTSTSPDSISSEIKEYGNWKEHDDKYAFEIDIPGFSKEEIELKCRGNYILINGKPNENNKRSKFEVVYKMPSIANTLKTSASLENGVLNVFIPKRDSETPKEISVKIT